MYENRVLEPASLATGNGQFPHPRNGKHRFFVLFISGIVLVLMVVLRVRIAPPDLAFYYSFAHSIVYDLDFSFANQYDNFTFGFHETYLAQQGYPANDWPMGTGVVWIPFLLLARIVHVFIALTGTPDKATGFSWFDQWIITYGATILYSVGSLSLTYLYCQRESLSKRSMHWAIVLMAIGSSFSYHLFVNTADSHPPSAFFLILFLLVWKKSQEKSSWFISFLSGCLLGIAGLIRPHNLIFILTPLLDEFMGENKTTKKSVFFKKYSFIFLGALISYFPQLVVWKVLYGSWLAVPRAGDVLWSQPHIYETLFSDYHGMISWSPLFGLGLLGLFLNKKFYPLLIPLLLQLYIYSCNLAWWCGGSFGNRRMVSCTPLLILGLAYLFQTLPQLWLKILSVCAALWTLLLLLTEVGGKIQLNHYQPWSEILTAIQTGLLPGMIKFFTAPDWSHHAAERIVGIISVLLFLSIGLGALQYLKKKPVDMFILTTVVIVTFNILCITAGWRTTQIPTSQFQQDYIQHDRFTWVVYYEKGFYLLGKKQYMDGLESMMAASITEPRHPEPWMYMAYVCEDIYGWSLHSYHLCNQALKYGKQTPTFFRFFDRLLTKMIHMRSGHLEMLYNQRGILRAVRQQWAEAESDFREAISIQPDYKTAQENLVILEQRKQGKQEPYVWQ